jgi:hypothetical protein
MISKELHTYKYIQCKINPRIYSKLDLVIANKLEDQIALLVRRRFMQHILSKVSRNILREI